MSADSASVQFVAKSSLSASLNAEAALSAQLGAGAAVVNDYLIQTEEIEDGHRLTITRGSEVQTMDLMDGVGIVGIEKTGSTGDVDSYRITFTDGSTFEYTVETNAATYAAAEAARAEAENSRVSAESERVSAESVRVAAENARAAAETARANAENERARAEALRVAAETERANAESGRVSAEQGRVSAESERVAAEEARATEFAGFSGEITQLKDEVNELDYSTNTERYVPQDLSKWDTIPAAVRTNGEWRTDFVSYVKSTKNIKKIFLDKATNGNSSYIAFVKSLDYNNPPVFATGYSGSVAVAKLTEFDVPQDAKYVLIVKSTTTTDITPISTYIEMNISPIRKIMSENALMLWNQGGSNASDRGVNWYPSNGKSNRISTDYYPILSTEKFYVEIDDGMKFFVGFVDDDGKISSTVGWNNTSSFINIPLGAKNVGFVLAHNDNSDISISEHNKCRIYLSPTESQLYKMVNSALTDTNNYKGKVISILGDSISTFGGSASDDPRFSDGTYTYIGNRCRYPQNNLLTDVNCTYWMRIINNLKMTLGINESWAGSRVTWDGTTESTDIGANKHIASATRISHLGENGTPDIILVNAGTNDIGESVEIGTFNTENPMNYTDTQIANLPVSTFADAYRTMLIRLQKSYPTSKIICLLPNYTTSYYTPTEADKYCEVIKEACDFFGIKWKDMRASGITMFNRGTYLPDGIHYNSNGMEMIAKNILKELRYDFTL